MLNNLFVVLQFPYQKDEYGLQAETDDVTVIRPFRVGRMHQVDAVQHPKHEQHEADQEPGRPACGRYQETDPQQHFGNTGQGIQQRAHGPARRYEPDEHIRVDEMQDTRQNKNQTEEPDAYVFHDHNIKKQKGFFRNPSVFIN